MPSALQTQVLHELHATLLGGHFGRDRTLVLARRLWWPGLPAAVKECVRTCLTCQRVKVDHLPPDGLLYLLPVSTRRGGCISLNFLELPFARSCHDFLQVHIDLLTGRVRLVPTFKTATAEEKERVPRRGPVVGLPNVSSRTATRASLAPSGRACTRRWALRSSTARRILRALQAR